jgi:hypothetical protein
MVIASAPGTDGHMFESRQTLKIVEIVPRYEVRPVHVLEVGSRALDLLH